MHYKVLSDNMLVDAVTLPCYVRYDRRLNLFRKCKEEDAQGIAAHDGSTYWHLSGRPSFGIDGYQTVDLKECDVEEVNSIITALDDGKILEVEEPAPVNEVPVLSIPDGSADVVKAYLCKKMRAQCHQRIESGFDIDLDKTYRLPVTAETKSALMFAEWMSQTHSDNIPFSTGDICVLLCAEDVRKIVDAMLKWEQSNVARCDSLCSYIASMRSIKNLSAVSYDMAIPDKYRNGLLDDLSEQVL